MENHLGNICKELWNEYKLKRMISGIPFNINYNNTVTVISNGFDRKLKLNWNRETCYQFIDRLYIELNKKSLYGKFYLEVYSCDGGNLNHFYFKLVVSPGENTTFILDKKEFFFEVESNN